MKYKIVVDSTVYLSEEELQEHGIKRASLNVMDGSETFKELKIDNDFVYSRLDKGHVLTTSQPAPGEFLEIYEDLLDNETEMIFVVTLAPPLSGTYQSAVLARNMLDEPNKVHIFKSKMAAFGNEMLVLELAEMIKRGEEQSNIIKRITALNETANLIFTVENLHHLSRSGRLSRAKALVGSVLRVKPLIKMVEGKLDLYKAERTHKKITAAIVKQIEETTQNAKTIYLRVLSKNSMEHARALEAEIKSKFSNIKLTFSDYLGPVFSLHLGTTGYGVSWCVE